MPSALLHCLYLVPLSSCFNKLKVPFYVVQLFVHPVNLPLPLLRVYLSLNDLFVFFLLHVIHVFFLLHVLPGVKEVDFSFFYVLC